jgi:hypothetical protein
MIFDEGWPNCANVRGSANEEEHYNNHAIEAEESTLN